MIRLMASFLAVAVVLAISGAAEARSWQRSAHAVGPYGGQWSRYGSGSCAGGSCSSHQSWTGPRGNTVTRTGQTNCGGGWCDHSATYTGPRGGTVTRTGSFSRY